MPDNTITKVRRPPGTTPKLKTPQDVENNFESHRRQLDEQARTLNKLLDLLRDRGILVDGG